MTLRRRILPAVFATVFAAGLLLAGCAGSVEGGGEGGNGAAQEEADPLARYELDGLDAREAVDRLDALPVAERPDGLLTSIRPDVLVVSDGAAERTLPMPDDAFYLSVAPYREVTHDCEFHSPTGCRGELAGEPVQITVTDAGGAVVLDEERTTFDNGFVGVWLPRDAELTLTIRHAGGEATAAVSTGSEDLTCLTSMRLS